MMYYWMFGSQKELSYFEDYAKGEGPHKILATTSFYIPWPFACFCDIIPDVAIDIVFLVYLSQ